MIVAPVSRASSSLFHHPPVIPLLISDTKTYRVLLLIPQVLRASFKRSDFFDCTITFQGAKYSKDAYQNA